MHSIEYERPTTLDQAVGLFARYGDQARGLAGGTDLLVQMRAGRRKPQVLIDLKHIPALSAIEFDSVKGLTLGASVPCYRIYGDERVREHYQGLIDVVEMIGGTPIQGRASVGGNLCNAAPSADVIPILIAYGAICHIIGPRGVRHLPVEEFFKGPGQNALGPNEFLVSLHLPPPPPHSGARYLRFTPRNEMDIAVAGAGVMVELDKAEVEGAIFNAARVALSSVAPVPLFVQEAGDALAGQAASGESIEVAAGLAKAAAQPIDDMRGTAEYRRHLCEVLTRRALEDAVARARVTS